MYLASNRRRLQRLASILAVAGLLAATVAAPTAAKTLVDPSTLNPPPPDFFNAVCTAHGDWTECDLHFADDPIVGEPSGIVCGSTELLFS